MTVVVLGAGGRLGHLMRPRWQGNVRWLTRSDVDVARTGALATQLAGAKAILCLAGVTNGSTRDMSENVALAKSTLDAAADAQAGHVFLFSSAAVYGALGGPLTESGPTAPLSDYARAKLAMEEMAAAHPHPNTALRLGNVAGADAILSRWRAGFHLDQLPDGTTPRRSYIGPNTLIRVLQTLIRTPSLPPVLNVAAPGAVEMGALLDAATLGWSAQPATPPTISDVILDTEALRRIIVIPTSDSTPEGIVTDWRTDPSK